MSSEYIYTMYRVDKFYGPDRQVLANISLSFFPGAKIGVLGPNGAGKSTLLRIMAGKEEPSSGVAELAPNASVGLLEQEPWLDPEKDVRGNVEDGVREIRDVLDRFNAISASFAEPDADFDALLAEQAKVQDVIDRADAWQLDQHLDHAMDALRLPEGDRDVTTLSGGERRRVALCRLLLTEPDVLLLDEPTNHLDAESVLWLEQHLKQYKGTVIAVTHDRYFLDNVAGWILELDRGHGIPWKGNYSSWLEQKQERLRREDLEIYIPPGPRLGDVVINFHDVSKTYGDRVLIEDLDLSIPPGSIVGVIGPNGAGKSTLLRMIVGAEKPDDGSITVGDTVQLAYVEQLRDSLDGERTVWQEISENNEILNLGRRQLNSRAYVASFNFLGADQQKLVRNLSGGERNRVLLAKMLKESANVILLDEPTNDLDVNTLRALEEALQAFAGCAMVVSHDRWFLDRVATHILAFEGESQVTWHVGNFADYEEGRRKRLGKAAELPHRITYKKLTR
jgi:ATPase subunit of ABC transporter with duplicated ATPase domains